MSNLRNQRLKEISQLKEKGINPYPYKYNKDYTANEIADKYSSKIKEGELLEEDIFSFAGRIMTIRTHGKSAFLHLKDDTGRIQIYVRKDKLEENRFEFFKEHISIGDWIGVKGFPFKTNTGELTILAKQIELLSKPLRQMPEKFHGLKDKEIKYRQRYVDMIANDEVIRTFRIRSLLIRYMREYLDNRGFFEVETPVLENILGGANARPFITHLNVYDQDMYLRIATELHLKRLVVGGMEKVYEIGRLFRNEGISYKHNPEFTTIELYQAYADYYDMMDITENMMAYITEKIFGTTKIIYQGKEIDFKPPYKRIKMQEFINDNLGIDIVNDSAKKMEIFLKEKGINPEIKDKSHYIEELWDLVENKIEQPTFIIDHPVEISPLAKRHRSVEGLTERFELIILGREMVNAFSELNDPVEQFERFKSQQVLKDLGDLEAQQMDLDFIRALEYGLPPTGGMGLGIDRFAMFLTNSATIKDVIAFPIVKPVDFHEEEKNLNEELDIINEEN